MSSCNGVPCDNSMSTNHKRRLGASDDGDYLRADLTENKTNGICPPTKKSRPADFSQIITRSTSISENEIHLDLMGPQEKIINDR